MQSPPPLRPAARGADGDNLTCASLQTRRPSSSDFVRKPAGRGWHTEGRDGKRCRSAFTSELGP
jgi:hypothetical protein